MADGSALPGWAWLIGALVLFGGFAEFLDEDDDKELWRNTGRLSTVLTFGLLIVAYAFYGDDQSRTWWEAVKALATDQLLSVLPVAILTQFMLMMLFWFLFGRLLGMPWKPLLDPVVNLLHVVTAGAGLLVFTVGLLGALHHQTGQLIAGLAGLAVWGYLLTVLGASRASRTQTAQYEQARVAAGKPPRSRLYRFLWGDPSTGSRWVQPTGAMLMGVVLGSFIYGIFAAIAAAIMHWMGRGIPGLGTTVQVELIVMTVALLAGCYLFRMEASMLPSTPPTLFHFADLSLALAACVVALTGLPNSEVTIGPVPVVVIAVGPALLVALAVYLVHVRAARRTTKGWSTTLAASLTAGLAAAPLKFVLTVAVVPLVGLLPLPSW